MIVKRRAGPRRAAALGAFVTAFALALGLRAAWAPRLSASQGGEKPESKKPELKKPVDETGAKVLKWSESLFPWGAGDMGIDEVPNVAPGFRFFRVQKHWTADARMADASFVGLDPSGTQVLAGELFMDPPRKGATPPVPFQGAPEMGRLQELVSRFFRNKVVVQLDPSKDRPAFRGLKFLLETGYGAYPAEGYISAHDGATIVLGRFWDLGRPVAEQRKALIKLDGSPSEGPPSPRVTIVEYSDMQCPFCKRRAGDMDALLQKLGKELPVRRVYKFFPLTSEHPWAFRASSAGWCLAKRDPALYFAFKKEVYRNQETLSVLELDNFAFLFAEGRSVSDELKGCYLQGPSSGAVLSDLAEGFAVRVRSTPTYFVDGVPVSWFSDGLMEDFLKKTYGAGTGKPAAASAPATGKPPAAASAPVGKK